MARPDPEHVVTLHFPPETQEEFGRRYWRLAALARLRDIARTLADAEQAASHDAARHLLADTMTGEDFTTTWAEVDAFEAAHREEGA